MLSWFSSFLTRLVATLEQAFLHLTQPARHSIALSIAADLPRSKSELIAENALLREQLIIIQRQIKKRVSLHPIAYGLSCSPVVFNTGKTCS